MQELLEMIAKNIVDNPAEVEVTKVEGSKSLILELEVADEDMGQVIGKNGKIAKSIRTVVKAAATKGNKRVIVEIIQAEDKED
ncbi:KH domain-containing protein [Halanaerobaculum tunisiense]